jgi:phosphatidylglycerophosphate synthase
MPGEDPEITSETNAAERLRLHRRLWERSPRRLRRMIVTMLGTTTILLGGLLVILPGPFTLPLVVLGLTLLATEYTWAQRLLQQGRSQTGRLLRRGQADRHDS